MKVLTKGTKFLLLVFSLALVVGCTKEKPFEFIANKETVDKGVFPKTDLGTLSSDCVDGVKTISKDTKEKLKDLFETSKGISNLKKELAKLTTQEREEIEGCVRAETRLAVVSYGQMTRTSTSSFPYFMGRTKLVSFEMGEHELLIKEIEKDSRFTDNPTNTKNIMSIPVHHVDYKCETDAYGECQNKEVENHDIPWSQRKYIQMNFEDIKVLDLDQLPIELTNMFSACYNEGTSPKLISREISEDVINLELERSYSINLGNPECWGEIADFEDFFEKLNVQVRYSYSIVKSKNLISKQYRPVVYEKEDEGAFGFFDTKIVKLDVDGNAVQGKDVVLLNRWNPERKVVPYYLSDEFAKPENDYILSATEQAVRNINQGLIQAKSGFVIQLRKPEGKKAGDLRNNMIVMVEDPLASRIIGYGPSVAHPMTGEIVNARTVMYFGTIKGIVKRTYEEIRDEVFAQREKEKEQTLSQTSLAAVADLKKNLHQFLNGKSVLLDKEASLDPLQTSVASMQMHGEKGLKTRMSGVKQIGTSFSEKTFDRIKKDVLSFKTSEGFNPAARSSKYYSKRIDVLSKNNVYPEELFNAHSAFESSGVAEKLALKTEEALKPWDDLSDEEKESIIRTVLPHIWIPTLVHELGHNLGLRHNFAGSEDKENFYTEKELQDMGISRKIPYASMMEYPYKTQNELPTMGKYDIAALKFAYAREVDAVDANGGTQAFKVESTLKDVSKEIVSQGLKLKEYRFCTDEHVYANSTCNRFDEGTNFTEIAQHYVRAHDELYKRLNIRNNRKNFSLFQEGAYLARVADSFYFLRLSFELYERIKNEFGVAEGHPAWQQEEILKDIYQASAISGQFFLSVLLTPDVHCAISLDKMPQMPIAIIKLQDFTPKATTCFHPEVQDRLKEIGDANNGLKLLVAGEGGKSFSSRKDPLNPNNYADQIDVQGLWIDKMLALEFLLTRELGSTLFDENNETYLTHGAVGPHIEKVLAAIMLGRGSLQIPFRDAEHRAVKLAGADGKLKDTLPVSIDFGEDHHILRPQITGLERYFGLPGENTTFQGSIANSIARMVPAKIGGIETQEFVDSFSVYTTLPSHSDPKEFMHVKIGTKNFYAQAENKVAIMAMQSLAYAQVLIKITQEEAEELLELKKEGKPLPEGAEARLKDAYGLEATVLEAYINGMIKTPIYYVYLLDSLIKY